MNPVDAITGITGHVLIRIGSAILGNQPGSDLAAPFHIGELHIHCAQPADTDRQEAKPRTWMRRARED
ncbi:hypothetical protein [Rhodococcus xishaensis]|uniref:Uncharacterized protein n=1 Tax=Rhodococcus xishaensis TaxID=2487364 RepID=A0A438AWH0_9NOCA|nr:hypothetical protein [Rhodococcus xishaensis]RVW03019.1 hypothetical protein EGT50_09935 [Rhodococcus xishaensis]